MRVHYHTYDPWLFGCTQFGPALNLKSQQKRQALARQTARTVLTAANHSCDVPSSARMPDFAVFKAEDERRIDERDDRKPVILSIFRL